MYNLNKQSEIDFFINNQKTLLSLEPNPLSSSLYGTTLGLLGIHGYVLLNRVTGGHFVCACVNMGC